MQFERVITEFRELLSQLAHEVEMSVKSNQTNIAHLSETLFCKLLNALYGWNLKNMNTDQPNFPAIDLADGHAKIAVQVTATTTLDKIKNTIAKFLKHKLNDRYSRLVILVITRGNNNYRQQPLDSIINSKMNFDVQKDIIDYRTLSADATNTTPARAHLALSILKTYLRGVGPDLADEDFNPPDSHPETLLTNLIPIQIPDTLYIADIVPEVKQHGAVDRQAIRRWLSLRDIIPPSDYEVRSGQLLTFRDLRYHSPFEAVVDLGTVTPLDPKEYYEPDPNQQRTFKSLLRLLLQQRLWHEHIRWSHEDHVFFFCPQANYQQKRIERWYGKQTANRTVFERRMKKADPNKVLSARHLAFSVDFLTISKKWYAVILPNWFFSFGNEFKRSQYAHEQISRLKKLEKEHSVVNTFRFVAWWLTNYQIDDLFSKRDNRLPTMEFGEVVSLSGGRLLDEDLWAPLAAESSEHAQSIFD